MQQADDGIIAEIEHWENRALRAADALWRDGQFYRDTDELAKPNSEQKAYYPTSTFVCVSAIHEADLARLPPSRDEGHDPSGLQYDYLVFLDKLKILGAAKAIASSAVMSQGDADQSWNPYTSAALVRALVAVNQTLLLKGSKHGLSDTDLRSRASYIRTVVTEQRDAIVKHLIKFGGYATLSPDDSVHRARPVHPFLTYYAIDALSRAQKASLISEALPVDLHQQVMLRAEKEAFRLLGMHGLGSWAPTGLIALADHAGVLALTDDDRYERVINRSLDVVCQSQAASNTWPLTRLWLHPPGRRGIQVCSFDIGATVAETTARLLDESDSWQFDLVERHNALAALFESLQQSFCIVKTDRGDFHGWGQEHLPDPTMVEAWVVAIALHFLTQLRRFEQLRAQEPVLRKYSTKSVRSLRSGVTWSDIREEDAEGIVTTYVNRHFIDPVIGLPPEAQAMQVHKSRLNVSMLLFGPPGTSKTTLVRALAREIEWPLVTITPSVFLADGENAIDARATAVFSDLSRLARVVILLDECDELFKRRPADDEDKNSSHGEFSVAALITGAMLPRLQDLHDRGKLIFVLATNRLGEIDKAVRRFGRFDQIIGMGPPNETARKRLLDKWARTFISDRYRKVLASRTERFTRSELKYSVDSLQERVRREVRGQHVKAKQDFERLENWLAKIMPNEALTISERDVNSFMTQRKEHCHAYRESKAAT